VNGTSLPVEPPAPETGPASTRGEWAMALNILGEELEPCSGDPLTGFYRDGCCNTGADDVGLHVVCAQMTDEFLTFSKMTGNDLSTPQPDGGFPGLVAGDRWVPVRLTLEGGLRRRGRSTGRSGGHPRHRWLEWVELGETTPARHELIA